MGNIQEQVEAWRKTRNSGALQVVSSFFEGLGLSLVRDGEVPEDPKEGDIVAWDISAGIEVKGSSKSPFRLEWDQLQSHKERAKQFPYEGHFWYMLFLYTARQSKSTCKGRSRKSLLQEKIRSGRGREFLAERVRDMWLVPVEALEALKESVGLDRGMFPCQEDLRTLRLTTPLLRTLVEDPRKLGEGWSTKRGKASVVHTVDGQELEANFRVSVIQNGAPAPQLQFVNWE